ncbi:hypothetical protein HPB49_005370 [Dermacentor silvarum]|uniref:Uncharacterized protein n=1 Tax=Dermacentor silvarum TaxID=543639 RepID=A0ACB8DVR9_DERSI|nr:hypothetical protein HPB49_005370 [Dermacentor silvarum]
MKTFGPGFSITGQHHSKAEKPHASFSRAGGSDKGYLTSQTIGHQRSKSTRKPTLRGAHQELGERDTIRLLDKNGWNTKAVVEKAVAPRSYMVRTEDGGLVTLQESQGNWSPTCEDPIPAVHKPQGYCAAGQQSPLANTNVELGDTGRRRSTG